MAQHNTKVRETWGARECVYVTLSYSLCSGSHLLLHLKPNKGQLFSPLTEPVKLMCCCAVSSDSEHVRCTACRQTQDLKMQRN